MDRAIEAARRVGEQEVEYQPQPQTSSGVVATNSENRITFTEASVQGFVEREDASVESDTEEFSSEDGEPPPSGTEQPYVGDPRSEEPESPEGEEQPGEVGSLAEEGGFSEEENFPEQGTPTPWNVYMYIVGTDVRGRGDFNVMRELLQDQTDYEYPWVAITFDFKKGERDPARGELRKSRKRSASSRVVHQTYPLGTGFDVVYRNIEALPANNQRIRHLHFLTHFGNDTIWYRPHTGSSTADLHGIDHSAFTSAFASDAVVKIHGCQQDRKLTGAIAEFCGASSASQRREVLRQVRDRIGQSYPFQLAGLIDRPVWATPLGAYAIYECSYLPNREKGRRFCVETGPSSRHTFQRTLGFYQANYKHIFDRALGEPIFDATFHMTYKPRLRRSASLSPSPCAPGVSPGGLVSGGDTDRELYETVRRETIDGRVSASELVYLADDAVSTGVVSSPGFLLGHVLPRAEIAAPVTQAEMEAFSRLSPAEIFDAFTTEKYPELRNRLEQVFEVLAWPLSPIDGRLYPSDCVVRRALGEGNLAHVAMLVTGEVIPAEELEVVGLRAEGGRLGDYAQVVEGGAFPHAAADRFARRLTREDGRLDQDTIILRLQSSDTSPVTLPSENESPSGTIPANRLRWEGASPEQLEFMRAVYERQVSKAQHRGTFVGDVPEAELEVIEGRHKARRAAAADCRALLDLTRAGLDREKRAGVPQAQAVESIHLVSAYRPASRQFLNWQHNFPRYYHQTRERRIGMAGGEHGEAAADYLTRYISGRLAAPGYSLHNDGRAVDFGTREGGEDLGANTNVASIHQWRQSWLFEWLTGNAARFAYYQNLSIDEPWHWEHRRAGGTTRGQTVEKESQASRERAKDADVREQIPPVAPAQPESGPILGAALTKAPVAVKTTAATRSNPNRRACCALGQWEIGGTGALDPSKLSGHRYGLPDGPVGYVYTSKAGLMDLGHMRDLADMTKFVYDALTNGSTRLVLYEGTAKVSAIPSDMISILELARAIAYVESWAHELTTWDDYSSFSPEDIPSNIAGIEVGKWAIKAGGSYDPAVDTQLHVLINDELGARPKADTEAVLKKIKGDWYKLKIGVIPLGLLRRNFDGMQWMAGMPYDAPESLPWLSPGVFEPFYSHFDYTVRRPVDGKLGVTLATMKATTDVIRKAFVAAHPGMDKP